MMPAMRMLTILTSVLMTACAGTATVSNRHQAGATFIVVRHAEKQDASRDTDLSPAGHARAQALADRLRDQTLTAVYATEFKRTAQTVGPSATAHGLGIITYRAAEVASTFAAQLHQAHPRGVVLIAGHSNTVPAIVAALCACTVPEMSDSEYDRLTRIQLDARGLAHMTIERYGTASTTP